VAVSDDQCTGAGALLDVVVPVRKAIRSERAVLLALTLIARVLVDTDRADAPGHAGPVPRLWHARHRRSSHPVPQSRAPFKPIRPADAAILCAMLTKDAHHMFDEMPQRSNLTLRRRCDCIKINLTIKTV
jgi:hypothetical protein